MTLGRLPWLTLLLALVGAGPAPAGESYYVIVFGSQRPLGRICHTHSFATFVKVTGPCAEGALPTVQSWTISWMPRTLGIHAYRLLPQDGVNLDLDGTLRWAVQDRQRISMWGPYQIDKELFDLALHQIEHLQTDRVRYKAVDTGFGRQRVSNCIHAVSDLAVDSPRLRIGSPGWGEAASFFIARSFSRWLVDPCHTHDWLIDCLGLRAYPLVRRDLENNPTRNPVLRAIQSAVQPAWQRRIHD
jgi:hypothetical protein